MSRTFHHGERRIRVKGVRRQPVDLRRLARALIELAQAEAEAAAQAEHEYVEAAKSKASSAKTREHSKSRPPKHGPEAA